MPHPRITEKSPNQETYLTALARESGSSVQSIRACLDQPILTKEENSRVSAESENGILLKIQETCQNLGYVPETPLWRARIYPEKADLTFLISKEVTDGLDNPYFGIMMKSIMKSAREEQIQVVYSNFDQEIDYSREENHLPPGILDGQSNKFILAGRINESLVQELMRMGANLVFLSRASGIPGTVSVVPDYRGAAKQAVQMLYAHGHRSIAIAGGGYFSDKGYNFRELIAGAMEAASELEISMTEEDIFIAPDPHPHDRPDFIKSIRSAPRNYTGVFCLDDAIAMALYMAAKLIKLSIPDDLSLVGCNDHHDDDQLSTVHVPARRMGQKAFEEAVLLVRNGRPNTAKLVVMPTNPTLRASIKFI